MERAVFFDGRSSRRRNVTLTFADRLVIADSEASRGTPPAFWPYDTIHRVDGPEDVLRLACTAAPPLARLELRDAAARANMLRLCPALDGPGGTAVVSVWRIAAASLAATAAILGMVWFGMPVHANLVGQLQAVAQLPVTPDPAVLQSAVPNAFALPGGRVYVLSGLLAKAQNPDELAGVLAHELVHVARRDGLKRLIREGGTAFLVGLLFGDVTGSGAVLMAGRIVLGAAHSRAAEEDADAFAVTVMHHLGRPTAPTGALLQRITGPEPDVVPSILRDHPLTPDRKAMLEADHSPTTGPVLLEPVEWQALKRICDH